MADRVVRELIRRADHRHAEQMALTLHVLGIASLTSDRLVIEPGDTLHFVARRVVDDDAGGEDVITACGQQLWSDVESPLAEGMRGSWQACEAYQVHSCGACAEHAMEFPEAREKPGDENLPPAIARRLRASVSERVHGKLSDGIARLAANGAVFALEAAEAAYEAELTVKLVERAHAGGDEVLRRVLMRYYDNAVAELAASGSTGPPSELMTEEDWREMVSNTLVDLDENDHGLVARSELYGELRGVLSERIRRARLLNAAS